MTTTTIEAGDFGVFLSDEAVPATLWEYQGENATHEHVFSTGRVSTGDFRLIHRASLDDFWALA
jgi:hypothetical protein